MTIFSLKSALLIFVGLLSACSPWTSETDHTLELAGENRAELEKVLLHYKEVDPDELKLKAAEYIISNMLYQYSLSGAKIDNLNKLYKKIFEVPKDLRHEVFNNDTTLAKMNGNLRANYDVFHVDSQMLIDQIEFAFITYNRFPWCQSYYTFNQFCEYILPFKIGNSSIINWREKAMAQYNSELEFLEFESGEIFEAELFVHEDTLTRSVGRASGGKVAKLFPGDSLALEFQFYTSSLDKQKLQIGYMNGHIGAVEVLVFIDGQPTDNILLPSDGNWWGWDVNRLPQELEFDLDTGYHSLKLISKNRLLFVDYLKVSERVKRVEQNVSIPEGEFLVKNSIGFLTPINDPLINRGSIKVVSDSINAFRIRISDSFVGFHQISFISDSGTQKVLDAYTNSDSSWVLTYDNFNASNQQWAFLQTDDGLQIRNRHTAKYLAMSADDSSLVQYPIDSINESFFWSLVQLKDSVDQFEVTLDDAIRVAHILNPITDKDFHWYGPKGNMDGLNLINLLDYPYGTCKEGTQHQVMVLRSLGVASATDFVINWADRASGHSWCVVFDNEGNTIQSNRLSKVGELLWWIEGSKKGKVYRNVNSINEESLFIQNNNYRTIPDVFNNPYIKDVTMEYADVSHAEIFCERFKENDMDFGYVQVFDNQNWTTIGWGIKNGETFKFSNIEKQVAFLPTTFVNRRYEPINDPFYLDSLGLVHHFTADTNDRRHVVIKRKYPNRVVSEWHHARILGGKFQGANQPYFADSVTIGMIDSTMLDPLFHTVKVDSIQKYKYFRYLGPKGGYCNISELVLFDPEGDSIQGEIIRTDGRDDRTKEKAFDGNVLTYFDAQSGDEGWVGLKLDQPTVIHKIRFAARNDGNMVEVGDEYELVYWDREWKSLGKITATTDSLVYDNVPSGGLYLLHNLTKGKEERIFTIDENGDQVWW